MVNAIYLNMSIGNLPRSREFFAKLGFSFKEELSGESSACMIIGENLFAMIVEEDKFQGFIDKTIAPRTSNEVIISLSCSSKEEIIRLSSAAFAAGARKINDFEENDFMYSWGFEDLDGHLWDLFCWKS